MAAISYNSSVLSSYYKMDHVLYEIKDQRGILKNLDYEPWKAEVISDLETSGFIRAEEDKFVITEEGRKVINYDSFLYYNQKFNLQKTDEAFMEAVAGNKSKFWAYLLGLSILFAILLILGSKLQILAFLFN